MKKLGVLFISTLVLLISGCALEEKVDTFYEMGCSSSFSDIFLTKGVTESNTYPLQIEMGLSCDNDVSVTIKFFDNGNKGDYKYFLVNGYSETYKESIYADYKGVSYGTYLFTTNDALYRTGPYYGLYEVTALNLETGEYVVKTYRIEAYDYHTSFKIEPFANSFESVSPQLYEDTVPEVITDNISAN